MVLGIVDSDSLARLANGMDYLYSPAIVSIPRFRDWLRIVIGTEDSEATEFAGGTGLILKTKSSIF